MECVIKVNEQQVDVIVLSDPDSIVRLPIDDFADLVTLEF